MTVPKDHPWASMLYASLTAFDGPEWPIFGLVDPSLPYPILMSFKEGDRWVNRWFTLEEAKGMQSMLNAAVRIVEEPRQPPKLPTAKAKAASADSEAA